MSEKKRFITVINRLLSQLLTSVYFLIFGKCKGCNLVDFSDRDCQLFAQRDHKPECKALHNIDQIPHAKVN